MRGNGKPVAIRAWEELSRHFHRGTDVGRYLLGRIEPFYKRALRKEAQPEPSTKQKEFKRLREEADRVFALYIRWRDTKPRQDGEGRTGFCCTCRQLKDYDDLQCGHWQVRKYWGTRWDEENCHAQCRYCNDPRRGGGRMAEHEAMIVRTRGEAVRDRILAMVKIGARKPSPEGVQAIINKFGAKLAQLKAAA